MFRKSVKALFRPLLEPLRIVGVSDSAYKIEEEDTRALVGHLILLMGSDRDASSDASLKPFGRATMIDYACRR